VSAEHRAAGRANVFLAAILEDGVSPIAVRIRTLSVSGALVEGPCLPPVGTPVRLVRGSLQAAGRLAWYNAGQAGLNFERPVQVDLWVKRVGHGGQQRVDDIITALRTPGGRVANRHAEASSASIGAISASLDLLCERLAARPDLSIDLGEELLKLDSIAQDLRKLAGSGLSRSL